VIIARRIEGGVAGQFPGIVEQAVTLVERGASS
jgi:hypothetical protein